MKAKKLTEEQINELCEYLTGTCNSLEEGLTRITDDVTEDNLHDESLQEIENSIFLCEDCGWWHDTDEMADTEAGAICRECHEAEED